MKSHHLFLPAIACLLLYLGWTPRCFGQTGATVCKDSRPDCPQAVAFFLKFQTVFRGHDHAAVAAMVRYPVRVTLKGKNKSIHNRRELLQNYDKIFDAGVTCAILAAKKEDVWGNWRGFTISQGAIWWEALVSAPTSFKLIAINNESFYEGCS